MSERRTMREERTETNLQRWGFLLTEMVLIVASILLAIDRSLAQP